MGLNSFAILRTRCVEGDHPSSATQPAWEKVIATYNIRCNFILDSEVSHSSVNDRSKALLEDLMVHSGFDLNLCGNPDNVLALPSQSSVFHLSFSSCYIAVELGTLLEYSNETGILQLPVTPNPWDFSWTPERSSHLDVDMNLAEAYALFQEKLLSVAPPVVQPDHANQTHTHAKVVSNPTCVKESAQKKLEALLESEIKDVNLLLNTLIGTGFILALVFLWTGFQLTKKQENKHAFTSSNSNTTKRPTVSSITIADRETEAISPVSMDTDMDQKQQLRLDLDKEWKTNGAVRRRRNRHAGKRFLVPIEDQIESVYNKAAADSPQRAARTKHDPDLKGREQPVPCLKQETIGPQKGRSAAREESVASFINQHWGC